MNKPSDRLHHAALPKSWVPLSDALPVHGQESGHKLHQERLALGPKAAVQDGDRDDLEPLEGWGWKMRWQGY